MITATIREAKARLNDLIDKALQGEDVVLLRGSKHVVALTPITDADMELAPRLTDSQAARVWDDIVAERKAGRLATFDSPEKAVSALAGKPRRGKRRK